MIDFRLWFTNLLKATGVAMAALVCISLLWGMVWLASSAEIHRKVLASIGVYNKVDTSDQPVGQEMQDASNAHGAIVSWVMQCTKTQDIETLPDAIQRIYYSRNPLEGTFLYSSPDKRALVLPAGARPPNRQEAGLIRLSAGLAKQRIALRAKAQSTYGFWQLTSVITIALGMITTILVSLSSTDFGKREDRIGASIRIFAIVFPALGTAAAAVVAFYGPQAEWSQASRTLASVTQLHVQMSLGLAKFDCVDNPTATDPVSVQLEDWSKRYVDIQTVAGASGQASPTGGADGPGKDSGAGGGSRGKP